MPGHHDPLLVLLSILVAAVASYTALDLAGRVRASTGLAAGAWLGTAAVAMGGGIWSMHFIAMLAFRMEGMEAGYDPVLTVASLLAAILVTGAAFVIVDVREATRATFAAAGVLMGTGIVAMHYTGMAAMRMDGTMAYDPWWVGISVVIAVVASTAALHFAFGPAAPARRFVSAGIMGVAISGMHYAGMQAMTVTPHHHAGHGPATLSGFGQTALALSVAGATFFILFLALLAAMFDKRFALLAEREAKALRVSEERFRSLYRGTPLPLVSINDDGTVDDISEAGLDLLGYSRNEVTGFPLSGFMSPESADRFLSEDLPSLRASGTVRDVERQFLGKDGHAVDTLFSAVPRPSPDGTAGRAIGGMVDVTERKRMEEALLQAQKMDAIGQLTGGVAHDFNNLLAVVQGNLELLRRRIPDDPNLSRLVENALQGTQRGAALTQRMLSFARQQSLSPASVDMPALVDGMRDMLQRSIGPSFEVTTRFAPGLPLAMADPNQLELALLNLVINARDAMPDGGTITISAETRDLPTAGHGLRPGRYVVVSVEDTGTGMDAATLAKVRDPFFTTKGIGKGTGLGLSMVHGFAEQSGGSLELRSAPGQGTVARILLPVAEADRREEQAPEQDVPADGRRCRVMAVDDDELVLGSAAAMLEDLGHEVVAVPSGAEALRLLRAGTEVDIVVTDHAMPAMTGLQLAAILSEEFPDLPVMMATGYATLPVQGAPRTVLRKPYDQADLARALDSALRDRCPDRGAAGTPAG